MPDMMITDVPLPAAVWTPLTPRPEIAPPPGLIVIANRGPWPALIKRSWEAPADDRGAWPLGAGQVAPPEDLSPWWSYRLWAFPTRGAGRIAVEALWPAGAPTAFGPAFGPDFF